MSHMQPSVRSCRRQTLPLVAAGLASLTMPALAAPDRDLVEDAREALGLRGGTVVSPAIDRAPGGALVAILPVDGQPELMILEPHSVRAEGFQVLVPGADGVLRPVDPGPVRTFRGTLLGIEGSVVAAALDDKGLYASILRPGQEKLWLEPLHGRVAEATLQQHMVYAEGEIEETGGTCGQPLLADDAVLDGDGLGGGAQGGVAGGLAVAELGCDADYEYFQTWGSGTAARIESVVNAVNAQYESEVGITHSITGIVVRTTSNDPYTKKPADQLLFEFRAEWQSNPTVPAHDLAQLFTGRNLAGSTIGIAWLGAVCTDLKYSVVESDFDGTSNFGCSTDLSAHEMGHNWNADHCSCANPAYTMNSYITCANRFSPTATIPEIVAFRDTRACLGGGGPAPSCGDDNCDPGEDPCSCPADCGAPPAEICNNGVDDDCDGLADCADPDCAGDPGCGTGGGNAIVDCITYTTRGGPGQNRHLDVAVTIVDDGGATISGASVSMTLNGTYSFGGTTDENGEVVFTLINAGSGCYTSDVTAVSGPGLTFDGSEPANGFQKGSDSTPDADCRSGNDPCGSG